MAASPISGDDSEKGLTPSGEPVDRGEVSGAACEFVKYPTLTVGGVSKWLVLAGFVGGAGPGVVTGEVDVFPAQG